MSTIFKVAVTGEAVAVEKTDLVLTSGSKGVYTAIYTTDAFWGGLTLEAVFIAAPPAWPTNPSARDIVRRSVPLADGSAFVHPDVLAKPGLRLWVGLQGLDEEGTIVKNSTLALVDKIQHGADPDGPGDGDIPATRYEELTGSVKDISAEVDDIRVGYNGTEYETAGDAVRAQIGQAYTAIDNQREFIETVGQNSLPFVITVTGENEVYSANQTYEDTMAAYNSGRRIVCVLNAEVPVDNGDTYYAEGAQIPLHNVLDDGTLIFQHGTVNPYGMSLEVEFMPGNPVMAFCYVISDGGEPGGSGGSGIHIGPDAPTDENIDVWIDTDEEPDGVGSGGSGCSGGINITGAEVGQTVKIAAVDENGVPTAWEAVDSENTEWEVISAAILEEDVVRLDFELEHNYRKLMYVGKHLANSTHSGAHFYLNNTFVGPVTNANYFVHTSQVKWAVVLFEFDPDKKTLRLVRSSAQYNNGHNEDYYGDIFKYFDSYANTLSIRLINISSALLTGCEYTLYGVKV